MIRSIIQLNSENALRSAHYRGKATHSLIFGMLGLVAIAEHLLRLRNFAHFAIRVPVYLLLIES